jgi:WD40 repeat protein
MQIEVEKIGNMTGHEGSVYTLLDGLEKHNFLSAGSDHIVAQWNILSMQAETVLAKSPGVVYSLCFLNDNKLLAVGSNAGHIHIIDLKQKKEIYCLQPSEQGVFDLQFDKQNNHLIAASGDGVLSFWETKNFKCTQLLTLTNLKLRQIALHPNSSLAAVSCGNNEVVIIDLKSQAIVKKFEAHTMSVNSVQFHPDGKHLLSGSRDAWLKVWHIENDFSLVHEVPAHNFAIYSIVFSPDGKLFATASRDKTIKLWNAENFSFLQRVDKEKYDGHINSVNKLIWNDNYLISAGDDKNVMLWKIKYLLQNESAM